MTDEQKFDKYDALIQTIKERQSSFEARMDMYILKTDQQMQEMRDSMKESKAKHEADIKAIRTEIREDGKQTRRMLFANMAAWSLGLIAILIAIYLK